MADINKEEGLKRVLGIRSLAACAVNNTIGGGIFVLPAIVAATLGPSAVLAYLICGILIFFIILCFAETGSLITSSGGAYAYIEAAFGPYAGFLANTLYWFGYAVISDAAIINALADIMAVPAPLLQKFQYRSLFFLIILGGLAIINFRGVKQGVLLVELSTYAKLIPILLLIIAGSFHLSSANLSWSHWPKAQQLGEVSLVLFFAYIGSENALSTGGEIKNPQRTVPLGMLLGIIATVIIYILIQIVSQGVLGNDLPYFKEAPLAELASRLIGPAGVIIITVGAAISIFGTISGDVLASPRVLFAASKNGLLPKILSKIHPRFATPYWSIFVYSFLIFILSISGGFKLLATISSAAILIIYLGVVLALIKLRLKNKNGQNKSFRVPFGLLIPGISIITIAWFLSHLAFEEAAGIGIFIGSLSVVYFTMTLLKRKIK
jgi:amino acid transporter